MEVSSLTPDQFSRFRDFIYRKSGIQVDEKKISMLSHRIRQRLKACSIDEYEDYYRHLTSFGGKDELTKFLDVVTTNETYFFRTNNHFEWFKKDYISEITRDQRAGRRNNSLRVWSAACSTGEEVYSIAICLAECSLKLTGWKLDVVGTDISEAVLAEARESTYRKRSLEEVDSTRLRRWMLKLPDDDRWKVRDEVAKPVRFVQHNLMEPLAEEPFDCIFIRNVLIYFDRESKVQVIKHLIHSLVPGGYLVVGPSEGIYDLVDPLEKKSTFLYQKPL